MKPTKKKIKNVTISAKTIVGPTGVPAIIEAMMPMAVHTTEIMAEQMVTDLKD